MLFNSIDFALFLPIVFLLYWFVTHKKLNYQNALIVAASYVFYGYWDWRFLLLILFSTVVDYLVGLGLSKTNKASNRKLLLYTSIGVNLGVLGYFKYCNFFITNFIAAFSFLGMPISPYTLGLILPVGISFYTFQTLSYSIDVYKRKLTPTNNFIAFSAFVSFFPQLVAGPIERASNLLPQFYKQRVFNYQNAVSGLRQILWGLFKKIVIADNCARYASIIFNDAASYSGSTLVMGAVFFAFQIYGDFSGYSDIAIGTSRLFGFDLKQNFAFPYFSRNIGEFWRRWHISLSTWFRDYLYIPLGGSRSGRWQTIRNIFIIFLVSGFWHGANWTFIVWGALNALYFLPVFITKNNRNYLNTVAEGRLLPSINEGGKMLLTFSLTVLAWIFFRAATVTVALKYISGIFSPSLFSLPNCEQVGIKKIIFVLLFLFLVVEWLGRTEQFALERLGLSWKRPLRYAFYYLIISAIFWYGGEAQEFIYFQF